MMKISKRINFFVLGIECDFCTPSISDMKFDVSSGWLKQEYPTKDLSDVKRIEFPAGTLADVSLFNPEGAVIGNLWALLCQCATAMKEENVDQKQLTYTFTEPTFVRVVSPDVPYIKINAVSMNVEVRHIRETRRLAMSNFAQWVLHELNSDKSHCFAATPSVTALLPSKGKTR